MGPLLKNEGIELHAGGLLRFCRNDMEVALRRLELRVQVGHRAETHLFRPRPEDFTLCDGALSWTCRTSELLVTTEFRSPQRLQHVALACRVENLTPGPLRLLEHTLEYEVSLHTAEAVPPSSVTWLRNGWQSWSHAGVVSASCPTIPRPRKGFVYGIKEDPVVPPRQAPFVSDMVSAFKLGDNAVVAGAREQRFFQRITVQPGDSRGVLLLTTDLDEEPLAPGGECPLGGWSLEGERTATVLVRRWAAREAARRPLAEPIIGWCSWYDRYRRITARYILQTAQRMSKRPGLAPLKTLVIDDGYQDRVGDWLVPARNFGAAVTELAPVIHARGLRPGIWVAPFIAQGGSALLRDHPEWFLQSRRGPLRIGWNPVWRSAFYALDIRQEGVLGYLEETFTTLRRAGFTLFKLDYLFAGALRAPRSHHTPGRFAAFRTALRRIRAAVGEESLLIGCGSPLAPARNLVDAMRVSTDITYTWETPSLYRMATGDPEMTGMLPASRNTLVRGAFAGRFFALDPDCLLLRRRKQASAATDAEAALFAGLAAHSGDVLLVGDDLSRWGQREETMLAELVNRRGEDFTPLDSADKALPVWALARVNGTLRAAAANLGEAQEMLSLPLPLVGDDVEVRRVEPLSGHTTALNEEHFSVAKIDRHTLAMVELRDHPGDEHLRQQEAEGDRAPDQA